VRPGSRTVHGGYRPGVRGSLAPPIFQTSVWVYGELEDYDAVARGDRPGHLYGRNSNENVAMLETALAELEGAEAGVATSSGMAAILVAVRALAPKPAPIVAPLDLYGGTLALFRNELEPAGYALRLVDFDDQGALRKALVGAGLALSETITNPLVRVADLPVVTRLAAELGVPVLVDNTFATPILCRPLELGATTVVHSVSKYIGGHSDLIAGVVLGSAALTADARRRSVLLGTTLGPFEAWLAVRGLRTLALRMPRHSASALQLAESLREAPGVNGVHYPTLSGVAQEEVSRRLLPDGAGGMLAIQLDGGRPAVQRLMERLRMTTFAASLGGVETTISHPEVTSHRALSAAERLALGIGPGTVRVSVGLEEPEDIVEDFAQALSP